jgi:hypothetical protein
MAVIRQVALEEGWQTYDLARSLVVFGALTIFLGLEKPENLNRLKEIAILSKTTEILDATVTGKPARRRYSARLSRATEVIRLPMPVEYSRIVQLYAATANISPNQACVRFLELGLVAYLKAKKALAAAALSIRKEKEKLASETGT